MPRARLGNSRAPVEPEAHGAVAVVREEEQAVIVVDEEAGGAEVTEVEAGRGAEDEETSEKSIKTFHL